MYIYNDAKLTCSETAPPVKGSEGTGGGARGEAHTGVTHTQDSDRRTPISHLPAASDVRW